MNRAMANTNVTIRIDKKAYQLAKKNTKYNKEGKAVIEKDDEWRDEKEWDDIFKQMRSM